MTTPTPRPECRFVDEHLADYLGNELSPADLATFRTHLAECPACSQRAAGLADAQHALVSIAAPAPDDAFMGVPAPMLASERGGARGRSASSLALAASILLAFTAGYLVGTPAPVPPTGPNPADAGPRQAELPRIAREYMHASRSLPASNSFAWALVSAARR